MAKRIDRKGNKKDIRLNRTTHRKVRVNGKKTAEWEKVT